MANAKNRQRVEDAYTATHIRALTLLEDMHQTIEDMPAPDDEHSVNWEHVGSLQYVCERLKELKDFVGPASE